MPLPQLVAARSACHVDSAAAIPRSTTSSAAVNVNPAKDRAAPIATRRRSDGREQLQIFARRVENGQAARFCSRDTETPGTRQRDDIHPRAREKTTHSHIERGWHTREHARDQVSSATARGFGTHTPHARALIWRAHPTACPRAGWLPARVRPPRAPPQAAMISSPRSRAFSRRP